VKCLCEKTARKIGVLLGITFLITQSGCTPKQSDPTLLEISTGKLQGQLFSDDNTLVAFKGIPFAQPPIGVKRWTHSQPAKPWTGIRSSIDAAPACMQQITDSTAKSYRELPQSEDCLYLNVFAPAEALNRKDANPLPVLFIIHGGGRSRSSASRIRANIEALNRQGIVVVTPQYRLGIFSFFAHPELSNESTRGVSGNYGMQDLVEALKWVKANIAFFGGDPNSVTILGPSGGGTSVGVLLTTPLSEGLFHRAAPLCSNAGIAKMHFLKEEHQGLASAEELGERFAKNIDANSISELRKISAIQIQHYVQNSGINTYDPPAGAADVIDGWMFQRSIIDLHKSGQRHDVPVLLGVNEDEVSLFETAGLIGETSISPVVYEERVKERYGELSSKFLQHYPSEKPLDALYNSARDRVVSYGTQTLARLSHSVSSPAFLYYMSHHPADADQFVNEDGPNKGVSHCTGYKYFFDWYPQKGAGELDKVMATTMSNYMVNFIKTGNPNQLGLPNWAPYDRSTKNYMLFEKGQALPSQDMLPGMWELYESLRERDEKLEKLQHWYGGWASDKSLVKSRITPD